ncbi:hypothetical protein HRI96_10440 [Treponema parvum]|uniref:Lipoprotein n=1 Tax=Treponema parvum TaxID=138851 RepID=A0A975F1E1_9SPIR|nr:hypothetical protein [Treponema parvum]QTQ12578.1 hypothetical protein HRI96_10440 [Treponema parvum]
MKKPILITVFVTAVFLLFTSCSNLFQALGIENSSGNGSLRVVLPEASPQTGRSAAGASRLAVNTDDIKTYTVTLSKDGVVIAEQTAAAGSSVTFSDIEEGTYTIRGSAYDGRARLAYGSITVRVSAGKTTNAAFPMYTTPPIVLWDYRKYRSGTHEKCDIELYVADTAVRSLGLPKFQKTDIEATDLPKYLNMEFDAARNLYTNGYFFPAASGYNHVRLAEKINGLPSGSVSYIYCSEDNILFMVDGGLYFCDPSDPNDHGRLVAKEITSSTPVAGFTFPANGFIAVSNAGDDGSRFLYTVQYDPSVPPQPQPTFFKITTYKITRENNGLKIQLESQSSPIQLGAGGYGLEVVSEISIQDDPSNPHSFIQKPLNLKGSPRVTDVRIHENEMYILFSYTYESRIGYEPSPNSNYVSSGALLKVKLDLMNGTLPPAESFGKKDTLGWTYELTPPLVFDHFQNFYGQWPSDENRGFFGPQKILALKSKKIWIADDGSIYENKKGFGKGTMVQKDRVVIVDLESESFESVYSFSGIGFSTTVMNGSSFNP